MFHTLDSLLLPDPTFRFASRGATVMPSAPQTNTPTSLGMRSANLTLHRLGESYSRIVNSLIAVSHARAAACSATNTLHL